MRRFDARILLSSLALSCAGGDGGGCGSNGDSDSAGLCNVEYLGSVPDDGSTTACYESSLEFSIAGGDPDATITVTDPDGNTVDGTTASNEDGSTIRFEPDSPLEAGVTYEATMDYCLGSETITFTTDDLGQPVADPKGLIGNTYVVDLRDARIVDPAGIGDVFQSQLTHPLLLTVTDATKTTLDTRMSVSEEAELVQDACVPTVDFPPADLNGASWTLGPSDITLFVAGNNVNVEGLEVTGTFSPDGSYFGCGGFEGLIDTRPLVEALDGNTDDFLCNLVVNYGAQCQDCADGEPYCLDLVVDQITAAADPGLDPVYEVTQKDVDQNPDCK